MILVFHGHSQRFAGGVFQRDAQVEDAHGSLQGIVNWKNQRAVEPDRDGFWWADMGPVDGPVLGPFRNRTEALTAERGWLVCWGIPWPMPTDNRENPATTPQLNGD